MRHLLVANRAMVAILAAAAMERAAVSYAGVDPPPAVPPPAPPAAAGAVSPSGKFTPAVPGTLTRSAVPMTRSEAEEELKQALNIRQTGPDTFQAGHVEFDKRTRTVTLPAWINSRTQILEYALVAATGKTHESLLRTDATPKEAQLAFLLLGAGPSEISGGLNTAAVVGGSNAVTIEVTWQTNGSTATYALSELIVLKASGSDQPPRPLSRGAWLYNGSILDAFGFAAQREGSFISVIRDPAALVNNPRDDRDNDHIHLPNDKLLPVEGWPVRITLHLPGGTVSSPPIQYRGYSPVTPLSTNYPK